MVNAMNMKKGNRVLLASQSPRRRELLKLLFADFGICVTNADETLPAGAPSDPPATQSGFGQI